MSRLHPASIAVRSLSRSLNAGLLFFVVGVLASPGGAGANLLTIGVMVLAGIVFGVVYELAYYRRFRYRTTGDTFDVTSGVVSQRDREVPLRRVQNVDVRQNALHRALGIAAVHVETAGGGETEITLRYVDEREARRLQRVLRRGEDRVETGDERADRPDRAVAEELLFELRPIELVILSVFTIDPGASILGGIAISFASGFDPATLVPVDLVESDLPGTGLVTLAWAALLFVLAAWALSAALTFSRYYGFRLTRIGDELHYERGLVQRYSGTIPLEKVQTITIAESVPFRWLGYASLAVETAGYAPGQSGSRGTESAIPLAARGRAVALARSIEPFDAADLDLESIPARARERYAVRYAAVALVFAGVGYGLATSADAVLGRYAPVTFALVFVAPAAAHLTWTSRGYRAGERYVVTRTGFWRRTTKVVPYYRVQAVLVHQTIFQRRRDLASVTADTASSASFLGRAAVAHDVDATRATEVRRTVEDRLQEQLLERRRRPAGRPVTESDEDSGGVDPSSDDGDADAE